ncbi:hypothetical protein [Streptomyces sp. NBC_01006]|uniref:hypothetical protein n=1 Tax=Streptomyces sp. NBC_01006 TaxID=2903716 RepID=UPI00386D113C|nr:hypothetical protein OG509_42395 [Streptomyces sp. NBC_01006]
MHSSMACTITPPAFRAGVFEDMEGEDNRRGFERDETDTFQQLVRHLVADGDRRAARAGHRARRTLAEMIPGYVSPPLLTLAAPAGRAR